MSSVELDLQSAVSLYVFCNKQFPVRHLVMNFKVYYMVPESGFIYKICSHPVKYG